ncbi:uncharacterized protein [Typha angustifolia]|uniref:uncharacterized protein n=1 Tax=Typha angustifolia TaxID=59011 RepID=UPI003C2F2364
MTPIMLKKLCFVVALFCIADYCCKAQQDSIQIVATAALCFDNRPVMNGCLTWMGINVTGSANTTSSNTTALAPDNNSTTNSTAGFCNSPCFGEMMLMMNCVDGIMSNFQAYNPGLMQGARALLQMSCGFGNNSNATTGTGGGSLALVTGSGNMMVTPNGNGLTIPKQTSSRMTILLFTICLLWC